MIRRVCCACAWTNGASAGAYWAMVHPGDIIGIMTRCLQAHRAEAIVNAAGEVTISGLPFPQGRRVEVIVLTNEHQESSPGYPLRGRKPFRYDRPDDPVGEADWEDGQ